MRQWFESRRISQQLVLLAVAAATLASLLSIGGLIAVDRWSFRSTMGAGVSRTTMMLAVGGIAQLAAAGLALLLARHLNRMISRPIAELASAIRLAPDEPRALRAGRLMHEESGQLLAAVIGTFARLRASNDSLRREVDEYRRAAELAVRERRARYVRDEFFAALSHELRTPLNSMIGWAQILAIRPPSPETLDRAAASLLRNARAQARVIDNMAGYLAHAEVPGPQVSLPPADRAR